MRLISWLTNWWGKSLRRRLLVSSLVTLLFFLILLGFLSFRTGQTGMRYEVNQRNAQLATLGAREIDAQFSDILGNVRLFTSQLEEASGVLPFQARAMLELRRTSPLTYRALYLLDSEGHLLIHLAEPLEELLAIEDVAEIIERPPIPLTDGISTACEAAKSGELFLSPTYIVGSDQVPIIYMGIPNIVEQGRPSQIVAVEIDLRDIWRRVDKIRAGQTGRAFIVSQKGTIIAHPDRAYIGQPLTPELRQVLAGYEGQTEYTDPISGLVMLASYSPVGGGTGWGIVVEQERAEAFASVNNIAFVTLGVLLAAIGMAMIVSILIVRSITRPIQYLAETTQTIARTGNLSQAIAVKGQDEVGQLATTFNQMIVSLKKSRDDLQQWGEELRESEEKFRTLTENVNVGIYRVTPGPKGEFIEMNPALVKILGYKNKKEVLSIHVADIYQNPKEREKFSDKVIRQGFVRGEELQLKKKDGTPLIASVSAVIVRAGEKAAGRDDAGNILYLDGIMEDITERKRVEEELRKHREHLEELVKERTSELEQRSQELADINVSLEEMSRHKSQFLANMSHELRTPLNSIIGYTKLMLDGLEGDINEEQQKDLHTVYNNSKHLLELINGLLDLSRIEAGKIVLSYEVLTISDLLAEVIPSIEPLAGEKGLALTCSVAPNIGSLHADRAKTKQVLINILGNAVKFTNEGSIKLNIAETDSDFIFSVTDTGIGMKKEDLEAIFESFKQVGPAQIAGYEGTGLGLAISKQFIEMQGGRIWAESEPGKGSTFTFTLPKKKVTSP